MPCSWHRIRVEVFRPCAFVKRGGEVHGSPWRRTFRDLVRRRPGRPAIRRAGSRPRVEWLIDLFGEHAAGLFEFQAAGAETKTDLRTASASNILELQGAVCRSCATAAESVFGERLRFCGGSSPLNCRRLSGGPRRGFRLAKTEWRCRGMNSTRRGGRLRRRAAGEVARSSSRCRFAVAGDLEHSRA